MAGDVVCELGRVMQVKRLHVPCTGEQPRLVRWRTRCQYTSRADNRGNRGNSNFRAE